MRILFCLKVGLSCANVVNLAIGLKNLALRDARYKDFRGVAMVLAGRRKKDPGERLNRSLIKKPYKSTGYSGRFFRAKKPGNSSFDGDAPGI